MLRLINEKGTLKVIAEVYSLQFVPDRPFVFLNDKQGRRLADLFIFSSVHPLNGRDDSAGIRAWDPNAIRSSAVDSPAVQNPWLVAETAQEIVLSLSTDSSAWRCKSYRFRCRPERFTYEVEVEGEGQLCEVNYFGGYYSSHIRWGSGYFWSGQKFLRGFTPEPNKVEINHFAPAESDVIDLMGVPLPGRDNWFFTPPPFCFGFEGPGGWVGMGIEAQPGGNRFTEYGYHGRKGGFHLSLSYEGYTRVDGHYVLPAIGFDFGADEFQVLAAHVQALQAAGCAPRHRTRERPAWWYEPIFCGWGAQCYLAEVEKGRGPDYSRQALYEQFLGALEAKGVHPGIVVLDDKWQAGYAENRVDEHKWPDLPGFIRRQHAMGRKVLLWLKAWDPEGIPEEECILNARGLPLSVDPSSPAYEQRLRESIRRMLAPEGYDADGFKIDFTARIPSGPGIRVHSGLWGLELMKHYLAIIYDEAKQTKQDALVMAHTPHPYLADVVDMIRLNDINPDKDVCQAMRLRARVAAIACPDAIIDTDNWPIKNRSDWRRYVRLQPELGVPSLYYVSHIDSTQEPLRERDYRLVRKVWEQHRARIPALARNSKPNKPSTDRKTGSRRLGSWRLLLLRLSSPAFRRRNAYRGQSV